VLTEINSKLVLFFFNKKYKEFYKFNKKKGLKLNQNFPYLFILYKMMHLAIELVQLRYGLKTIVLIVWTGCH